MLKSLPDNIIKGDVWPTGEDWFKFDLTGPGTIVAQMDLGTGSADLKLYGPDEIEIISERVSEVGMIHHTSSDLGEYYLLIGDFQNALNQFQFAFGLSGHSFQTSETILTKIKYAKERIANKKGL